MKKMLNILKSALLPTLVIIFVMVLGYFLIVGIKTEFSPPQESLSATPLGSELQSTSTADMNAGTSFTTQEHRIVASTTPSNMVSSTLATDQRFGSMTLGSVIISSSSVGTLIIHDATSTSDDASTTVAWFDNDNNASPGTYVFDTILTRGLMLDFGAGYFGGATITWR